MAARLTRGMPSPHAATLTLTLLRCAALCCSVAGVPRSLLPPTPPQVYQEVVLGFNPATYSSQLEWAPSADGTRVPLTVAHRRDLLRRDGSNVAILHA